jgi:hypothetical protein
VGKISVCGALITPALLISADEVIEWDATAAMHDSEVTRSGPSNVH